MTDLTELDGVGESRASNLAEAGYESVEDLPDADAEAIAEEVSYLPEDTALELIVQSQNIVAEKEAEVTESEQQPSTITEEVEEAVEQEEAMSADESLDTLDEEVEEIAEESEELEDELEEESGDEPEQIEFTISFNEALQYDTLFQALMSERASRLRTNRTGVQTFEYVLGQLRVQSLGDTVELSLTGEELNSLHNCIRQQITDYKGDNLIDHMDALKEVMVQIDDVRSRELF